MPYDHIHFGAGRRSLGMVLPLSSTADARIHIVVHENSELSPSTVLMLKVQRADGEREVLELPRESLSFASAIDGLEPAAREALETASDLLLTTAISDGGIESQCEFLVALAQVRAAKGMNTVFIACEEEIGEKHTRLMERLETLRVDVRRSVANRLCTLDKQAANSGARAVCVDEHVEWFIEGEPTSPMLEALAQVPGVTFTHDIDCHALRARWLARGILLALALLAAEANQPQVRLEASALEREGWFGRVCAAFVPLVEQRCPTLEGTADYAEEQVRALLRHDDDLLSVLDKLRRADLLPLLRELQRSLAEPCRALVAEGVPLPSELHRVFFALGVVLGEIEGFCDYYRYVSGDMLLTEDGDAKVIAAFRELLTGIFSQDDIRDRAKELEFAFERHRGDFGLPWSLPAP